MSRSGSETRRLTHVVKFRVTKEQYELLCRQAEKAGVSLAALARFATLDQPPLRASRQPSLGQVQAAQILGLLGQIASDIRDAKINGNDTLLMEAIHRDIAELRTVLIEEPGQRP